VSGVQVEVSDATSGLGTHTGSDTDTGVALRPGWGLGWGLGRRLGGVWERDWEREGTGGVWNEDWEGSGKCTKEAHWEGHWEALSESHWESHWGLGIRWYPSKSPPDR
jgi:hypothetical protein